MYDLVISNRVFDIRIRRDINRSKCELTRAKLMEFNSERLEALLDQLEQSAPPAPTPTNIVEFIRQNASRLQKLVERGWPLDLVLQQLMNEFNDAKKPSLRTLRTHYKRAVCTSAVKKKRGRPRGGNKNAQVTAEPSPIRESLREFLK